MVARSAAPSELQAHALDLLSALGPDRARRMFGGAGFYIGEHFAALLANDVLYLKADATAQPAFEGAGSQPFTDATTQGRRTLLADWTPAAGRLRCAHLPIWPNTPCWKRTFTAPAPTSSAGGGGWMRRAWSAWSHGAGPS